MTRVCALAFGFTTCVPQIRRLEVLAADEALDEQATAEQITHAVTKLE